MSEDEEDRNGQMRRWAEPYVGSSEGEHGEEDDGQLGFRDFDADSSQNGHDGTGLEPEPQTETDRSESRTQRRPEGT